MIAINKADCDNVTRADRPATEYRAALQILTPQSATWAPPVLTISGLSDQGLDTMWAKILEHREKMTVSGEFAMRRQRQAVEWMHEMLNDRVMSALHSNPKIAERMPALDAEVRSGRLLPTLAVDEVLALIDMGGL